MLLLAVVNVPMLLILGGLASRTRSSDDHDLRLTSTGSGSVLGSIVPQKSVGEHYMDITTLVATFEAMARFGASHPQGRSEHHAYAGSGTNGDDLPRFEVN